MPKRTPPRWARPPGKDAANNKPTYATLLGASEAKRLAADLRADAQASLAMFGDAPAASPS